MSASHRLQDAERQVSAFARAVALKRATVTGVAGFGLAYAVQRGWITPGLSVEVTDTIADLLELASFIGAGAWIHRGTTPADSALQPVNSEGIPLVPDPAIADAVLAEPDDPDLADAVTRQVEGLAATPAVVHNHIYPPPPPT
ncbi:MAG: hypothetical protein ABI047_03135 [Jatrophihabitantaceae bacterium]